MRHPPFRATISFFVCLIPLLGGCAAAAPSSIPPPLTPTVPPTETPQPTPQATLTNTLAPTSAPFPDHFDVPAWVIDPAAHVMLLNFSTHDDFTDQWTNWLSLVNVDTGQQATWAVPNLKYFFWQPDGTQFGFITQPLHDSADVDWVYVVDSASSAVTRYPATNLNFCTFCSIPGVTAISSDPYAPGPDRPGMPHFTDMWYSHDMRYKVFVNDGDSSGANSTEVEDRATGLRISVPKPAGRFDHDWVWSPTESILAVTQYQTLRGPSPDDQGALQFFDAASGRTLKVVQDIDYADWSADGRLILYDDGHHPCVLNWRSGDHFCMTNGQNLHGGDWTGYYQWTPDPNIITFSFWNSKTYDGGLCFKDLTTNGTRCPTMSFSGSHDGLWTAPYWSPDAKVMLALSYHDGAPNSDQEGVLHTHLIDAGGAELPSPFDDTRQRFTYHIWRPAVQPK